MIKQIVFSVFFLAAIFLSSFKLTTGGIGLVSHLNVLMIILGGTLGLTLMVYPWKKLVRTLQLLAKSLRPGREMEAMIKGVVSLAWTYRKNGNIRSLEQGGKDLPPGLLKTGVELLAYNYGRDKIEQILHQEALCICSQYEGASKILLHMAKLAPSLGLTATLVNLIRVWGLPWELQELMEYTAVAFLSLFYGIILANLALIPLASRLKEFTAEEEFGMDLVQEGILSLHDQEHPRAIQYKLENRVRTRETAAPLPPRPKVILLPEQEVSLEGNK